MKQTPNHQQQKWLQARANESKWYGEISKEAGVTDGTVVKWMVKHNVFTEVPAIIAIKGEQYAKKHEALSHIIIPGNPVIKKNSNPTAKNGMRLPNKNYVPYAELNIPFLKNWNIDKKLFIDYPITIQFLFYRNSVRTTDISNLYEAPQDILVKAEVLADDNCNIIVSHHSNSRVLIDKVHPRTEIYFYRATRYADKL